MLLELTEAVEAGLWATHKRRALKALEERFELYMMRAYRKMEARFAAAYQASVKAPIAEAEPAVDWIDGLNFERDMNGGVFDAYATRAFLGGHAWTAREMALPPQFRLPFPEAHQYLANYGAQEVRNISHSTRRELRDVLFRSRAQGWSYDKLAALLKEKWEQFRTPQPQQHIRSRAHLIAVTETGNAYEHGNAVARQQVMSYGLLVEKSWLMVGDDRTCMICMGNATSGWFQNERGFPSGHQRAPGHPACRCTIITRVDVPSAG